MKRIYRVLILAVSILIFSSPIVYAANTETMSKEEIMKKYYELKDENQKLQDKNNDLYQKWADEKIEISNVNNEVLKIITIGSAIGLVIAIVMPMGIFIYVKKHIKNKIEKIAKTKIDKMIEDMMVSKIDEKVSEQVEEEKGNIEKMILKCKKEENLKKNKEILVISKSKKEEDQIKNLLKPFKNTYYFILGKEPDDLSRYDVILFNDINGKLFDENNTEAEKIIDDNRNNNAVYFYFTKETRKQFKSSKTENINFAKSNSTLCSNLIDLMNYQDDILLNKNNKCQNFRFSKEEIKVLLLKYEGEKFYQKRGQSFTYKVNGSYINPSTTNYNIPIKDITEGFKRGKISTTSELQDLRGPSYIYAFVNDDRFKMDK